MSTGKPVRLGLVIGQLTVGGAEGQLLELVRHLDARFKPIVYTMSSEVTDVRSALAAEGITVREIVGRGMARVRHLRAALLADEIDVAHSWLFIANAYVAAATLPRAPWQLVTSARNCKVQGRVSQVANAMAFRLSHRIVVNSSDVESYIAATYGAPRERVRIIVNGVDTERFHPCAEIDDDAPPHIVTVGRIVRQKNHELFLRAAARLLMQIPEVRFTIVGDGPLRPQMEALAATLGIGAAVTFAGERRDVDRVLRGATLFWLTSRWEGMPNAVLEALASGVPVVTTAVSGTRELIGSGEQGFIVAVGDETGVVDHSLRVLSDPVLRASMRLAARERALQFSPERMSEALMGVYEELLGEAI